MTYLLDQSKAPWGSWRVGWGVRLLLGLSPLPAHSLVLCSFHLLFLAHMLPPPAWLTLCHLLYHLPYCCCILKNSLLGALTTVLVTSSLLLFPQHLCWGTCGRERESFHCLLLLVTTFAASSPSFLGRGAEERRKRPQKCSFTLLASLLDIVVGGNLRRKKGIAALLFLSSNFLTEQWHHYLSYLLITTHLLTLAILIPLSLVVIMPNCPASFLDVASM